MVWYSEKFYNIWFNWVHSLECTQLSQCILIYLCDKNLKNVMHFMMEILNKLRDLIRFEHIFI